MLAELLAENRRRFAPEYGAGLTNHLPMCLVALRALGASDARLREFFEVYARRLEPAQDRGAERALSQEIESRGARAVVADALDELAERAAASAVHGPIRLAYALLADDPGEVAQSIAYWRASECPYDALPAAAGDPIDLDAAIVALGSRRVARGAGALITDWLRPALADEQLLALAHRLHPSAAAAPGAWERLAALGFELYRERGDFVALHLVTGTHAVLLSASPSAATPIPRPALDPPGWSAIAGAVLPSEDDHLAKLVLSLDALAGAGLLDDAEARAVAADRARAGRGV